MAGGSYASHMVCTQCLLEHGDLVRAERSSEGLETDWYHCENRHHFGISWDGVDLPDEPGWPPSEKQRQAASFVKQALAEGASGQTILQQLARRNLI